MLALALIGLAAALSLVLWAIVSVAAYWRVMMEPRPPMTDADALREAVRLVRERAI